MSIITTEQIIFAFHLLTGHKLSSNDRIVEQIASNVVDIDDLSDFILINYDYQLILKKIITLDSSINRHPLHLPYLHIDHEVSPEIHEQMIQRIHLEWEKLGKEEPYWSTITQPNYKIEKIDNNKKEFYDSGLHSVELLLAALRRNSININGNKNCFEFGCGVGRMTWRLAQLFSFITAVDISSNHINIAYSHLEESSIDNVDFIILSNTYQFDQLGKFDLVVSLITLQHNPPPLIRFFFKKLLNALNPGGIAYIQIPSYISDYTFEVESYLNTPLPSSFEMHCLTQEIIFHELINSNCKCIEVREDLMTGSPNLILSNSFLVKKNS